MEIVQRFRLWLHDVARLPWIDALHTLRERFREDRLGLTASSLTFTTTIALVPCITVALVLFSSFPMFAKFQIVLQKWLVASLVPDNIARQVLSYLTQFSGKASRLSVAGVAVLLGTALALIFTIDRTLNNIWRVRTPRPFAQKMLIYWAAMTLGPLLLAASLSLTSYAISASRGWVEDVPGGVALVLDVLQYLLVAAGMASMFRYVPNTYVRWGHAWMGGLFVSTGLELAKMLLAMYLKKVPTYAVVYGAFATVPILLVWIYVAWVIVLLGAALTAYVPSLLAGVPRRRTGPGWQFQLALEVLRQLVGARVQGAKGLTPSQLCGALRVDSLRLEPVLEALVALDWIGQLTDPQADGDEARYIVLINPQDTSLQPLVQSLLLPDNEATHRLWSHGQWPSATVAQAL